MSPSKQVSSGNVGDELDRLSTALLEKCRSLPPSERRTSSSDPLCDYLQTKLELLVSYCIDVNFYLLLKVEAGRVEGSPAIDQLIFLQAAIERCRPIDSRMKHQLDALLATLQSVNGMPAASDDQTDEVGLRPRLSNLVSQKHDGGGTEEEDEGLPQDGTEGRQGGGIYQPPKLASVAFDGDSRQLAKDSRRRGQLREKIGKSELLRGMRSEVLGTPEEVVGGTSGVAALGEDIRAKLRAEDKEKDDWETDNFQRRTVSKKERQSRKRLISQSARLETIADVGDVGAVWGRKPVGSEEEDAHRDTKRKKGHRRANA